MPAALVAQAVTKALAASAAVRGFPATKWTFVTSNGSFSTVTASAVRLLCDSIAAPAFLDTVHAPLTEAVAAPDAGTQAAAAEVLAGILRSGSPAVVQAWLGSASLAGPQEMSRTHPPTGWLYKLTRSAVLGTGPVETEDDWLLCLRFALTTLDPGGLQSTQSTPIQSTQSTPRQSMQSPPIQSLIRGMLLEPVPQGAPSSLVAKRLLALGVAVGELVLAPDEAGPVPGQRAADEAAFLMRVLGELKGSLCHPARQVQYCSP
jgi:hypothetical protein